MQSYTQPIYLWPNGPEVGTDKQMVGQNNQAWKLCAVCSANTKSLFQYKKTETYIVLLSVLRRILTPYISGVELLRRSRK